MAGFSPVAAAAVAEPGSYRATGALRDGTALTIRAVRPDDKPLLREVFRRLSAESIQRRFFQPKRELTDTELRYLTELDFHAHVGLVALAGEGRTAQPVGVGRFIRLSPGRADRAEAAFAVVDAFQGRGVGPLLLHHLAVIGRQIGIRHFEAEVQEGNRPMLEVFEHSGLPLTVHTEAAVTHVLMALG